MCGPPYQCYRRAEDHLVSCRAVSSGRVQGSGILELLQLGRLAGYPQHAPWREALCDQEQVGDKEQGSQGLKYVPKRQG